jgi:cytochrome b subunit of formate dehydrogenase
MATQQSYVRFTLAQRLEHIVLLVSFTTLALTGLPQKFAGNAVAEWAIAFLGGITIVRTIHHAAAIVFTLMAVYHAVVLFYKVYVTRVGMSMVPGLKDVTDAFSLIGYNLGLRKHHPMLPRYSFEEKVEYWAMIWGTVLMALTGFMLWNPIVVTNFLPGVVIPAAKAAHGAEALLAVLAILVWHFYGVHIKAWNTSMWSGRLSRQRMEEEHGQELAALDSGLARPRPDAQTLRQRQRVYVPVAVVMTIVPTLIVYLLVTSQIGRASCRERVSMFV